jgi:outer membrane receptor protein involved in Fe transport
VYGSDAIAGVINFILRQEFKGLELTGEYGDTTHGGASFKRATGTFGFGNLASDRFNVMLVGSYQKEGALFGRDRGDFAAKAYDVTNTNDTTSGNTFPGQHHSRRRLGRARRTRRRPTARALTRSTTRCSRRIAVAMTRRRR